MIYVIFNGINFFNLFLFSLMIYVLLCILKQIPSERVQVLSKLNANLKMSLDRGSNEDNDRFLKKTLKLVSCIRPIIPASVCNETRIVNGLKFACVSRIDENDRNNYTMYRRCCHLYFLSLQPIQLSVKAFLGSAYLHYTSINVI